MKQRVAIYIRVSTEQQTTLNQTIRLTEYAKVNNLEFELFEEVQSSRKTRPVKAELLQRLRAKEFDAVLVYKLDRWARSSTELILEVNELVNKEIGFVSISENLDFTTSTGRLHFTILSAFADFERSLISERTKEGLHRAKLQGKQLGRPKGSKDSKVRKKAGYFIRAAKNKQLVDKQNGVNKELASYL